MGHMQCKCGYIIPLKQAPERYEKLLLDKNSFYELVQNRTDEPLDKKGSPFVSAKEKFWDDFVWGVNELSRAAIECPECGRLWIKDKTSQKYTPYKKES